MALAGGNNSDDISDFSLISSISGLPMLCSVRCLSEACPALLLGPLGPGGDDGGHVGPGGDGGGGGGLTLGDRALLAIRSDREFMFVSLSHNKVSSLGEAPKYPCNSS